MEIDQELLRKMLEVVILNGFPMVGIYWFLERPFVKRFFESIKVFVQQELGIPVGALVRYTAIVLSILVSVGLYALYAALGYATMPVTFEEWANLALFLGGINFAGTQIIHSKDLEDYN